MITIDDFLKLELKVGTVLEASEVEGSEKLIKVTNLEPRKMMGLESQGMILCADGKKPIPLKPVSKVSPGTKIG